jgi:serine/threonine protein kinase
MLKSDQNQRPDCIEILNSRHLWALTLNEFNARKEFENIFEKTQYKQTFINKLFCNLIYNSYTNYIRNGYFGKEFKIVEKIGEVVKAHKNRENKLNAIKIIKVSFSNEIEFTKDFEAFYAISQIKNEKLLDCSDLWLEYKNNSQLNEKRLTFYIQMDLCDKSLLDIMKEMEKDSYLMKNSFLTTLGYYLASGLFVEILEAIDFLHKKNIIHSKLKPQNILLTIGSNNGFIKIAETGLEFISKYKVESEILSENECNQSSDDMKEIYYLAPEVVNKRQKNSKSDIYSLGIIFQQLFFPDMNKFERNYFFV